MERLSDPIASIEEYRAVGGMRGLERALSMTPEAVIDEVEASGLRGRGGAGFPTGSKWRSIRNDGAGTRFVVANGAEGEPATFKDRWLMRRNPYVVVEGLAIASYAVGAAKSYVGVKQSFEREATVLVRAIEEVRASGLVEEFPINVVLGPRRFRVRDALFRLSCEPRLISRPLRMRARSPTSSHRYRRWRPEELIAAVHTIAAGDSLLSPSVTRRVIDRMAQQPTPDLADQARLDELTPRERGSSSWSRADCRTAADCPGGHPRHRHLRRVGRLFCCATCLGTTAERWWERSPSSTT